MHGVYGWLRLRAGSVPDGAAFGACWLVVGYPNLAVKPLRAYQGDQLPSPVRLNGGPADLVSSAGVHTKNRP